MRPPPPPLAALLPLLLLGWAGPGPGPAPAAGARILGVFAHVGKSHWDVFEPLMRALAARGHSVTVIGHFPLARAQPNYTDVSIAGSITDFSPTGQISVAEMRIRTLSEQLTQHRLLAALAAAGCEAALGHPAAKALLASAQQFDLLITELFTTDCTLAFAHRYRAPHIALSSSALMPWANGRFGNPDNPAYIPNLFLDHGDRMTFWERLSNAVALPVHLLLYEFLYRRPAERIARKHFGEDLPPIRDLAANASLVFVNSHFSLTTVRPTVPGVIEVAGMHLPEPKPLPQDIKEYLDGAPDGVIYFNMGSMIRATTFEPEKLRAFVQAFEQLPQRVLWKWEAGSIAGQPANVRTSKWLPQFDVLSHPNVRVYIGHGGLLGSIEAAHAGVPMLALPVFGDQRTNVRCLLRRGMALRLEYTDVTTETVLAALRQLLYEPRFADSARRVSRAFRDRPQPPLETAVWWTEYVLRHRGARHLRSAAADLGWAQLLLLDVGAALAAAAAAAAAALWLLAALAARLLCRRRPAPLKAKSH